MFCTTLFSLIRGNDDGTTPVCLSDLPMVPAEGKGAWRDLLGGKGAGLAEMTALGIRVPPGCTISTEACRAYYAAGNRHPEGMWDELAGRAPAY